jgi:hypothetical protein
MAEARGIGRGRHLAVMDCDIGGDARSERLTRSFQQKSKTASPLSRWEHAGILNGRPIGRSIRHEPLRRRPCRCT